MIRIGTSGSDIRKLFIRVQYIADTSAGGYHRPNRGTRRMNLFLLTLVISASHDLRRICHNYDLRNFDIPLRTQLVGEQ